MKPNPLIRALRNKLARATVLIAQLSKDKDDITESLTCHIEVLNDTIASERRETDRHFMRLQKGPAEKRDAPQWVKLGKDGRPL